MKWLGREVDEAYMERAGNAGARQGTRRSAKDLRIVFTPIHGTGGVIIKPMLERLGFQFSAVVEQDQFDGRFPPWVAESGKRGGIKTRGRVGEEKTPTWWSRPIRIAIAWAWLCGRRMAR